MAKAFQKNGSVADIMKKASEKSLSANTDVIKEIELDKIIENDLNKFSMKEELEFEILKESIRRTGVLQAVILKKNEDDTYTIIAGHRRVRASKAVGKTTIPANVRNYDDEGNEALDLVETNLTTRKLTDEDILSSIEILENILKNSDTKITGKTSEYIGKMLNMSGKQVERYRAVNNLIPELKEKVINKEIGMSSVTGIASFPEEKQKTALAEIEKKEEETGKPVSREQVQEIKKDIDKVDTLIPELKEKVESKEIDLKAGAELSTLPIDKQSEAHKIIESTQNATGKPVSKEQATEIKKAFQDNDKDKEPLEDKEDNKGENSILTNKTDKKNEPVTLALENQIMINSNGELSETNSENEKENASLEIKGVLRDKRAKALQQLFSGYITDYLLTHDKDKYLKNLKSFNEILSEEIEKVS